jgi:RND family efflux transporter MFP subunit
VKEGAVVVTLNVKPIRRDLEKAEAQLKFSEAEVAKAKVELAQSLDLLERQKKLTKFISEEDLRAAEYKAQAAQHQIISAEAKVAEERASVNQLRDLIAEAQLRAPFNGVIGERFYDPGVWVKQNTPLVRVSGGGEPRVRFAVPEEETGDVAIDRPVMVELGPKDQVSGRISHVAAEIDPASGTLTAEVVLDPKERAVPLVPGAVARVFVQPSDARVENFRH